MNFDERMFAVQGAFVLIAAFFYACYYITMSDYRALPQDDELNRKLLELAEKRMNGVTAHYITLMMFVGFFLTKNILMLNIGDALILTATANIICVVDYVYKCVQRELDGKKPSLAHFAIEVDEFKNFQIFFAVCATFAVWFMSQILFEEISVSSTWTNGCENGFLLLVTGCFILLASLSILYMLLSKKTLKMKTNRDCVNGCASIFAIGLLTFCARVAAFFKWPSDRVSRNITCNDARLDTIIVGLHMFICAFTMWLCVNRLYTQRSFIDALRDAQEQKKDQ